MSLLVISNAMVIAIAEKGAAQLLGRENLTITDLENLGERYHYQMAGDMKHEY